METQNVSAQLFVQQLKPSERASSYGCTDTGSNLSTCIDPIESGKSIENAFQQQLDLSEHYKSPTVFDEMKKAYTDQTMDKEQVLDEKPVFPDVKVIAEQSNIPLNLKESFGSKESFGGNDVMLVLIFIAVIVLLFLMFKK